jgi:nucleoside-diphosphate-sugar epimerase
VAGLSIALSGLPNGRILSFPSLSWPPSSSSLFASWETLASIGHPVDIVHCAPTLIENMYEHITETGNDFKPLSSLKVLQPGGAALSADIIKVLVANGVNVKTTYGSTEIGPPFRTIPHSRDNSKCYSFRSLYPDNDKLKMEKVGEGLYECVVHKGFELAADLWSKSDEPFRTNDLFVQDPPGSGFYVMQGRKDDIIIHTNGENTSGGSLQSDIQGSSKFIKCVLALGHSKPCVSLLVEVKEGIDPAAEGTKQAIWEAVEKINDQYPSHSHVLRSMIYILPKGKRLPVTPKGNVKRKEAEQTFANEVAQLYSALEGHSQSRSPNDTNQSIGDFIKSTFAEVAGVSESDVKCWTTIYELGIDSRLALSLRSSLSKRLGPITLSNLFEHPSPSKLHNYIKNRNKNISQPKPDQSQLISHLLSKLTSEFQTWPARSPCQSQPSPKTETILLTGATGTLGNSLLEVLSASPRVSKIYALIRGPNHVAKLHDSLSSRNLDVGAILGTGKVEVLNYSMQDPLLGLTIEEYAKLASTVTIVLHNAWKMDFNLGVESFVDDCLRGISLHIPYLTSHNQGWAKSASSSLFASQLLSSEVYSILTITTIGTLSLLRLAHSGSPKTFAFNSSIATCTLNLPSPIDRAYNATSSESDNSPTSGQSTYSTGYALSKYLTESLLASFSKNLQLPVRILRLGQLSGHTKTGCWNESEMWPILFKTSLALDALPILSQTVDYGNDIGGYARPGLGNVDWLPVDVAAEVVGDLLLGSGPGDKIGAVQSGSSTTHGYKDFNIVSPHSVSWTEMLRILQRQLHSNATSKSMSKPGGSLLKEISLKEWVALLNKAGDDGMEVTELPGLKLLPFFEGIITEEPTNTLRDSENEIGDGKSEVGFDTTATQASSETLRECQAFSEDYIEKSMRWWRETGFIS